MKYLVTSASGDLATQTVDHLKQLVPIEEIAVTVRNKEKGAVFATQGIDVRIADYFDKSSLIAAFQGIERVLFVSSGALEKRALQHKQVIEALVAANVSFVAYTSVINAPHSHALVAPDHQLTEDYLQASGLNYVLLRNNWYLENEATLLKTAKETLVLAHATGDAQVGWALKNDYAEAAARILAGVAPQKRIYELTGQNRSYSQLAHQLSQVTGTQIVSKTMSIADYTQTLKEQGLPEAAIGFISGVQKDILNGELAFESDDLALVLGRPQTNFSEYFHSL